MVEEDNYGVGDHEDELQSLIQQLGERVRKDFAEDPLTVLGIPVPEGLSLKEQHQIAADVLTNENFHSMAGKFWVGGPDVSRDIREHNEQLKKRQEQPIRQGGLLKRFVELFHR